MAQELTTKQVGNVILPDDPDYIPPTEKTGDEQELAAQQAAEADRAEQDRVRQEEERTRRVPAAQNLDGEARRLREQRDRLRADNEAIAREREGLKAELARFQARQEVQREAEERLQRVQRDASRPNPEEDPYGAQLWDMQQELAAQKKMREQWEQMGAQQRANYEQQQQQNQILSEVQNYVGDDVARYKEENPDFNYDNAAKHVHEKYVEFWQQSGCTPQEAEAVTANTFMGVARAAQMRGKSAAAAIANLATMTGYNPQEEQRVPANGGNRQPSAQERIARVQKAQKLQGMGGKTPSERTTGENIGMLTPQQIAEMGDDEYLRLKQDPQQARLLERRLEELG